MAAFLPTPPPLTRPARLLQSPPRRTRTRIRSTPSCAHEAPEATRRQFLSLLAATPAAALPLPPAPALAHTLTSPQSAGTVFSVIPSTKSDVNLLPEPLDDVLADMAPCEAVFLGEHHNSLVDHALQSRIIDRLASARPVAVGLEMVQQAHQPHLDRYIAREISELDLYLATDWENTWVWPYELYLPVLRVCRQRRIPLVALSMDSDTLSRLRATGISALSADEMRRHVGSPAVFSAISAEEGFKTYVNECITPSYAAHYKMGVLGAGANFNGYYTARVLRDEAMATQAVRYTRTNPDALLVCLMGGDHVKFEYGVPGRVQRQLAALYGRDATVASAIAAESGGVTHVQQARVPKLRTVMLNPGPADAYDYRDRSLKLELAVASHAVPISDYLWFSSVGDAKPRRQAKSWVLPPVEHLANW